MQYVVSVLVLLSAGAFILCGVVNYWWVVDNVVITTETGLWKSCTKTFLTGRTCYQRGNLFEFAEVLGNQTSMHKDIIIIALIVAVVSGLIHLICMSVTMCQRYPAKSTILIGTIFLFFGMASSVFGTIWALVQISHENQGWAFYALYGGDGAIILAFIFSIVLLCSRAPGAYRATNRDDEIAMIPH